MFLHSFFFRAKSLAPRELGSSVQSLGVQDAVRPPLFKGCHNVFVFLFDTTPKRVPLKRRKDLLCRYTSASSSPIGVAHFTRNAKPAAWMCILHSEDAGLRGPGWGEPPVSVRQTRDPAPSWDPSLGARCTGPCGGLANDRKQCLLQLRAWGLAAKWLFPGWVKRSRCPFNKGA